MDVDFHYYATFAAAKLAGWATTEAKTIAYSAQFVDEFDMRYGSSSEPWCFTTSQLPSPKLGAFRFDQINQQNGSSKIRPRRTVQSPMECIKSLHVRKDIWMPFHFLPGNYGSKNERDPRHIKREGCSHKQFDLLCRPFSPLAISMINDLLDFNTKHDGVTHDYLLHLVGLRMHVFADTWAHQDFVGDGVKSINDCLGYYNFIEKGECLEQLNWDVPIVAADKNMGYSPNVQLPRAYLGHGRLGHFPDYSWCRYYYSPAWMQAGGSINLNSNANNVKMLVRDNPVVFQTAFFEMVKVLYALKNKISTYPNRITLSLIFGTNKVDEITNAVRGAITLDRSEDLYTDTLVFAKTVEKWKDLIKDHCGGIDNDFNNNEWKDQAKSALINAERTSGEFRWDYDKFIKTDLYKFNLASEHHYAFVKTKLRNDLNYELDDLATFDKSKVGLSTEVIWQPDDSVSKCPVCKKSFGFLFRKHHCRKCGRVVCANCAPEKRLRQDRICKDCSDAL
ncbi:MAG: DUF6765 family protein [Gammaproteobacteria bacterium]